jgi:hypothetical protein
MIGRDDSENRAEGRARGGTPPAGKEFLSPMGSNLLESEVQRIIVVTALQTVEERVVVLALHVPSGTGVAPPLCTRNAKRWVQ